MKIGVVRKSVGPCGPCGFESHPRYRRLLPREQVCGPATPPAIATGPPRQPSWHAGLLCATGCVRDRVEKPVGTRCPAAAPLEGWRQSLGRLSVFGRDCTGLHLDHAPQPEWIRPKLASKSGAPFLDVWASTASGVRRAQWTPNRSMRAPSFTSPAQRRPARGPSHFGGGPQRNREAPTAGGFVQGKTGLAATPWGTN